MFSEKWSNNTFPSSIPARKNAEVVWIPVGAQGTLVIIGGALNRDTVVYRTDVTPEQETMGPLFVQTVDLYDIANDKWYTQPTSGDIPRATSEFCTVVAPSQDGKSFQVSPRCSCLKRIPHVLSSIHSRARGWAVDLDLRLWRLGRLYKHPNEDECIGERVCAIATVVCVDKGVRRGGCESREEGPSVP